MTVERSPGPADPRGRGGRRRAPSRLLRWEVARLVPAALGALLLLLDGMPPVTD